jgi:hypothetical protein
VIRVGAVPARLEADGVDRRVDVRHAQDLGDLEARPEAVRR